MPKLLRERQKHLAETLKESEEDLEEATGVTKKLDLLGSPHNNKISKISKELNKHKELKISDDIKKILQVELSNKRTGLNRTTNKSKGIKKPTF